MLLTNSFKLTTEKCELQFHFYTSYFSTFTFLGCSQNTLVLVCACLFRNTVHTNLQSKRQTGGEAMNASRNLNASSRANRGIILIIVLGCSVQLRHPEASLPSKKLLSMRISESRLISCTPRAT